MANTLREATSTLPKLPAEVECAQTATKLCGKCGQVKLLSEFSKHKRDGHQMHCKMCMRAYLREWNRSSKGRQIKSEYQQSPAGRAAGRRYNSSPKGLLNAQRARKRGRIQVNARAHVRYYVQTGRIKVPENCEGCNKSGIKLQAHHHRGYEGDAKLDVIFLCKKCHTKEHTKNNVRTS